MWNMGICVYSPYVSVCLHIWLCNMCMSGACRDLKKMLDAVRLELYTVVCHRVGTGN